ncbi:MAG: Hint domain-containing protein [Paracoccaceae bacterium]|jgi:hypothetical protein|nr:Hint domain-containing protein [Paracoccaceae bacterium]MDP7186483.1 Hint domain-containing protein [Paracoccaceae bacterium]
MAWFAYSDHHSDWRDTQVPASGPLVPSGTLLVQVRINDCPNNSSILKLSERSPWPRTIELWVNQTGQISLRITAADRADVFAENGFGNPTGAKDLLVTYAWDAPRHAAYLTVSDSAGFHGQTVHINNPPPLFHADLLRLAAQVPASPVAFVALSDRPEPVGPMPGISLLSLINTPDGPRRAGELTTGDLIHTSDGVLPILARANHSLPATGLFAPVVLHAPFHGLKQSLSVARHQQIVFEGSEVEYDLGQRSVLISAGHLTRELLKPKPALITYCQFLLPRPVGICAHGTCLASVNIGRLRRNREDLALSLFGNLPEELLPDHGEYATKTLPDHMFRMHADGHHF